MAAGPSWFRAISPVPDAFTEFRAISPVPDVFAKFPQRPPAPWSLLRGLCWNHLFRPFCACRPRSVMRGLCRNHRFRPFCTSPFSWIYSGFICLEGASRRSARAKQVSTNADLSGFMPDLCRIYIPKKRLPGERHEKYGQINPTPR